MSTVCEDRPPERVDPRLLGMAFVLVLGTFMASLDSTIVHVGLPTLSARFGATVTEVQWASTAYLLAVVTAAPLSGWLAERFGARRTWLSAVLVFLLGSVACGLAWSVPSLAVFRVVQGFGGGLLAPTGQALLARAAGPGRIGRIMSVVGIVPLLAPVLGPLAGGALLSVADWPWLFYVNVPAGLVAIVLARRIVPVVPPSASVAPFDLRGALLLSPGLAVVVFGLTELSAPRSGALVAIGAIIVGVGMLVAFTWHALRSDRVPLLDPRLFATPPFSSASLVSFVAAASVFGTMFLLPMFLQTGGGLSTWETGLVLAPQGLGAVLGSLLVQRTIDRVAPRVLVMGGLLLVVLGTVPLTRLGGLPDEVMVTALLVRGLGTAMVSAPVLNLVYSNIERDLLPRASSALSLLNYVGGALGTAVLAVLVESRLSVRGPAVAEAFSDAFWCVLGLCVLALLGASRLPRRARRETVVPPGDGPD